MFGSDAAAAAELDRLAADCAAFAHGLPDLATIAAPALAAVMAELGSLKHRTRRMRAFAELRAAEDSRDLAAADLSSLIEQRLPEIDDALRSFTLAWLALPDELAATLAGAAELDRDRHFLTSCRRFAPHTLTVGEESALAARGSGAELAWRRFWFDVSSALTLVCDLGDGEREQTISDLRAGLTDARPAVRATAHAGLSQQSSHMAETAARCLDAVVGDRLATDRLRGYDDPMLPTHLDNQLEPRSIEAMLSTIERRSDVWQRWMRIKAAQLGEETLAACDRHAPIGEPPEIDYGQAVQAVTDSFAELSPQAERTVAAVFAECRVDAAPRPGKMGGAFCSEVDDRVGCFVLLNHTGRLFDAQVMAHELGHALNFDRCFPLQSVHVATPTTAVCEVPSTLAELMLCDGLHRRSTGSAERAALIGSAIETAIGSVFDVAVAAEFEREIYALKATGVTLTGDRLDEIWSRRRTAGLGDSVTGDSNSSDWAVFPHFLMYRFYMYSYAFACLVALALMARRRADPDGFATPYLEFLDRGGAASPAELLEPLGIDLHDPGLWDEGLAELDRMMDEAEWELQRERG
ncbi:MAG: oligoendopeptidase [Gaiellales bacterium]|jgi:oligoendopeptidase F|nr:oligoendopeptidase [Gaiellales bacterium]